MRPYTTEPPRRLNSNAVMASASVVLVGLRRVSSTLPASCEKQDYKMSTH